MDTGDVSTTFSKVNGYVFSSNQFTFTVNIASLTMTPGKYYRFKYRAVNVKGFSDYSGILTVPVADVPTAPTAPILKTRSKTAITVEWSAASGT